MQCGAAGFRAAPTPSWRRSTPRSASISVWPRRTSRDRRPMPPCWPPRHHLARRCRRDRGRSRPHRGRNRGRHLHLLARPRRHPHERRSRAWPSSSARRPGGCTRRARATTRWRSISSSGCARRSRALDARLRDLQIALAEKAFSHADAVMPGFTHLQSAQPVTFGHHLMAYVEMVARDRGRLRTRARRLNESPLGAAALAGTSFPIDRAMVAAGARVRPPDRQFARFGVRPRFRARGAERRLDLRGSPVALRRGDRALGDAAIRLRGPVRQVHDRLLDHAAEAQSRRGGTGARQDRAHHRRPRRPCSP